MARARGLTLPLAAEGRRPLDALDVTKSVQEPECAPWTWRTIRKCAPATGAVIAPLLVAYRAATPTAAGVLALFAPVAVVHLQIAATEVQQMYGLQAHHLLVCDALGLDHTWYEAPLVQKNTEGTRTP